MYNILNIINIAKMLYLTFITYFFSFLKVVSPLYFYFFMNLFLDILVNTKIKPEANI